MRFGVCAGAHEARAVLDAGFDYLEIPASGLNGLEPTWDPAPYDGLPIEATNLFFDPGIRLFGPDRRPYEAYAARTIERAASLGVKVMVIGSGKARRAPPDFDGEAAFVEIVTRLQALATPYGIEIAPESLNRDETNVGVDLGKIALGLMPHEIGVTADSYHLLREWDLDGRPKPLSHPDLLPFDSSDLGIFNTPIHVHLGPLDRGMPSADDPLLRLFAAHLRNEFNYDGRVSLEVNRGPDFDLVEAHRAMLALFAEESTATFLPLQKQMRRPPT